MPFKERPHRLPNLFRTFNEHRRPKGRDRSLTAFKDLHFRTFDINLEHSRRRKALHQGVDAHHGNRSQLGNLHQVFVPISGTFKLVQGATKLRNLEFRHAIRIGNGHTNNTEMEIVISIQFPTAEQIGSEIDIRFESIYFAATRLERRRESKQAEICPDIPDDRIVPNPTLDESIMDSVKERLTEIQNFQAAAGRYVDIEYSIDSLA